MNEKLNEKSNEESLKINNILSKYENVKEKQVISKTDEKINTIKNSDLPVDFSWVEYIQLNSDLKSFNKINCENHYVKHGKNEGRKPF